MKRRASSIFKCDVCKKLAGRVFINPDITGMHSYKSNSILILDFVGEVSYRVEEQDVDSAFNALEKADVKALKKVKYEYAPFFCKECEKVYCRDHWDMWDDDGDTMGRCPKGHDHYLDD